MDYQGLYDKNSSTGDQDIGKFMSFKSQTNIDEYRDMNHQLKIKTHDYSNIRKVFDKVDKTSRVDCFEIFGEFKYSTFQSQHS